MLLGGLALLGPGGAAAQAADGGALGDATVLLLRHAHAPGGGDPPEFRPGDCSTQRNLDDAGRAQARRMGALLRARGVPVAAVWTSPWCRTRETARLAWPDLLPVDRTEFGSFFGDPAGGAAQTLAAQRLLSTWQGPGVLVVITHQVNITALSGVVPAPGEGIGLRWREGRWQIAARLPAP